jgi:hypothetical protein
VRNNDSAYGLSLLTRGRLNEATTPRFSNVASIVAPLIGLPLSECNTSSCHAPQPDSAGAGRTLPVQRGDEAGLWKTAEARGKCRPSRRPRGAAARLPTGRSRFADAQQ